MTPLERAARAIECIACEEDGSFEWTWSHENVRHNRMIEAKSALDVVHFAEMQAVIEAARALAGGYEYMNSERWNTMKDALEALDKLEAKDE